MLRFSIASGCIAFTLSLAMVCGPATCDANELPNILIVYADDLGYGDLSAYNPDAAYQTPRLDQMAREGIRFLDAHSPCTICSPSRYGLFSGELVCRTGRRATAFEGPSGPSYLTADQLSLAEMLQRRGYRTGVFGKWHLGLTWYDESGERLKGGFENSLLIDYEKSTPLEDGPNERGFDKSFITPNCPTTDPLYVYIENGMVVEPASQRHRRDNLPNPGGKWRWDNDEGWMAPGYRFVDADLLFYDRTVKFIQDHRQRFPDRPFFAVLSTQISHAPVLPAGEFNGVSGAGPRGDFVRELDTLAGRLLDLLKELQIDSETLVIFNSDNGPETLHTHWMRIDYQHDAAGGLRGMKRDGWEGGHRVPMIFRWPGRIPAGQVSNQLANTTDIFATLASIVGYELSDEDAVDSYDLLPAMIGGRADSESIRPYMLTQSFRGEYQLRQGPWKYLDHTGSGGNNYEGGVLEAYQLAETAPEATGQLFNLDHDPGETTNLFFSEAERRREMQELLSQLTGQNGRTALTGRKPIGIENIPKLVANGHPAKPPVVAKAGRQAADVRDATAPAIDSANAKLEGRRSLIHSITKQTLWGNRDGQGKTWFHPRVCMLPDEHGQPMALMTLQEIRGSDYFGPVHWSTSRDLGRNWSEPQLIESLGREPVDGRDDGLLAGVCDVTPQYHPPSKSVLALGHVVFYKGEYFAKREQLPRYPVYAVRAANGTWSERRILQWDDPRGSYIYSNNCGQRVVLPSGDVQMSFTFGAQPQNRLVAGVRCSFDGKELEVSEVGPALKNPVGRGLLEPSVTKFGEEFWMTMRAEDGHGYVSVSSDGLSWEEKTAWSWDDGGLLSMSTTQQHWLTHSDGLFLVYTRQDDSNKNVIRWRSPLWLAQVDTEKRCLIRETEQIVLPLVGDGVGDPDHVALMGNFDVTNVSPSESWVTVGEWMPRSGYRGDVLLARIHWSEPNDLPLW